MFGYHVLQSEGDPSEVRRNRQILEMFAHRNGFRLGRVFVQQPGRSTTLQRMIVSARRPEVTAVAVVSLRDLGDSPRKQRKMRERVEIHAGVTVLVVEQ